jgi:hypothetical protein
VIYWSVDAGLGSRVGFILLLTGGVNDLLKLAFHGPRPYWYSTQVKALASETSFGVPSGHSQMAVTLWGMLAAQLKRPWAWAGAVVIIFMIGLSRLYLGVHFVHDVLVGWAFGFIILWAVLRWWDAVAAWAQTKTFAQQVLLAFLLSILILLAGAIAYGTLQTWVIPAEWLANARAAGAIEPAPVSLSNTITSAATLFGLLAGLAWCRTWGGFDAGGSWGLRSARFLAGLLGVLILYVGLGAIFPRGEALLPYILRYLRYTLIGWWIAGGAPWLFVRFGLAKKKI